MVSHQDDDASKFGSSMSLPMLVFHHHPTNAQQEDNDDDEDEMLMFSISQQSLMHTNMKRVLAAAGSSSSSSSMCWATPQGWILLVTKSHDDTDDNTSAVCLWNPLTGDKLPLPDIRQEKHRFPQSCRCLLSHDDPTRPAGCVVVLFSLSKPELWYCHVINGDGDGGNKAASTWRSWRHYSYDIGNYKLPEAYHPPTKKVISTVAAFQGRFYFINSLTDMCAIDFFTSSSSSNDDDDHDHDHPHPAFHYFDARMIDFPKGMSFGAARLLDCDDQLFLVFVSCVGVGPHNNNSNGVGVIRVYKMCFLSTHSNRSPRWRRVRDIGDTVFLLDGTGLATSCSASLHGLKRNQVYLMKNFVQDDADLCVFDLESECQQITRVHHHDGLLLHRKPFWIVPPRS